MPIHTMMANKELAKLGESIPDASYEGLAPASNGSPIDIATIERCVEAIQWLRPMSDPKTWVDFEVSEDSALSDAIMACRHLANRSAAVWALMPAEPTIEIIEALYGPYLSETAHESRVKGYKAALIAAQEKP